MDWTGKTKKYKNCNFQNDGASWCFDLRLSKSTHLLILVCSFLWRSLKLYNSIAYQVYFSQAAVQQCFIASETH